MVGPHRFHGERILRLPVLDVLRFVEHQRVELQLAIALGVAPDERVSRDDQIALRNLLEQLVPAAPCSASTFNSGVNFFASATQLKTSDVGQMMQDRPGTASDSCGTIEERERLQRFPEPISSARIPPKLFSRRNCSQATPCF